MDQNTIPGSCRASAALTGSGRSLPVRPAGTIRSTGQCGEPPRFRGRNGFTLIELLIVLTIMGILITIAQPNLKKSVIRAREAVLRENLYQVREAIDQYYADNGKYPGTLSDLINTTDKGKSYLRSLPRDPFTEASDWITVAPEGSEEGGVFDVHSASPLVALDNTPYNTW